MRMNTHDEALLKRLTAAITEMPRANTKEIAEAAGISRATFNRFCGSREHLIEMIAEQAEGSLMQIREAATGNVEDYTLTLKKLLDIHMNNEEYLVFLCGMQDSLENPIWDEYLMALDYFFLSGQKKGFFRVDITAQMISELFVAMICGVIDAGRRDRIARAGAKDAVLSFFLNGAAAENQ